MTGKLFPILVVMVTIIGCRYREPAPEIRPEKTETQVFVGLASYYSPDIEGETSADGSRYDPMKFTAAHRTLPFGTRVSVTNLENNRTVIVTITDRGPFRKDRLIDLSFAAAQQLDMLTAGVVRVRVEVLNE